MARVPALRYNPGAGPYSAVRIDLMAAIRLVVIIALIAVETRVDLSAHTDSRTSFDERYFGTDSDSSPDDFVAAAQRPVLGSPFTGEGVDIRATDAACLDLNVDVKVFKWLGFELQYKSARSPRGD
jgi:hypothetical protein